MAGWVYQIGDFDANGVFHDGPRALVARPDGEGEFEDGGVNYRAWSVIEGYDTLNMRGVPIVLVQIST